MTHVSVQRHWYLAIVFSAVGLAVFAGVARGQGDLIGSRGGQAAPGPLSGSPAATGTVAPLGGSLGNMLQGLNLGGSSIQNGLGPIVSGLAQNGVRGQQLASVIQDLQAARQDSRARDITEDRREIRDDVRRLRDDQQRLARDRQDLQRDLRDRDDRDRSRDIREDRREIRDDERRLRDDQQRLSRDRQDLQRDVRDRDDRDRSRDIREDRREIRDDERRIRDDQQRLARDRDDLRHDLRDHTGMRGSAAPTGSASTPTLPSNLHLPPQAQSSLVNGLNSSGTATRHGMGWIVSDMSHQGMHGQQLSDAIHQLKPYKQQGVLSFPQNGPAAGGQQPGGLLQQGGRAIQNFGKGRGKGK